MKKTRKKQMPAPTHIGLDNPAFRGRLRQPTPRRQFVSAPRPRYARPPMPRVSDVGPPPLSQQRVPQATRPLPLPTQVIPSPSRIQPTRQPTQPIARRSSRRSRYSKLQLTLFGMAFIILGLGATISVQTFRTNRSNVAQIAFLAEKSANEQKAQPAQLSTVPPNPAVVAGYTVAPSMPRFLSIPKLKVQAIVRTVATNSSGNIGMPGNIFDVGWFNQSTLPGTQGAMMILGQAEYGATPGVFANLDTLKPGDTIQIQQGNNVTLTYQVEKTQTFTSTTFDLQSTLTPVTPHTPGLNLVAVYGGKTAQSSADGQKIVVYASQI